MGREPVSTPWQLCFYFHALMNHVMEPLFLKVPIVSCEAARGVLFINPGGVPILFHSSSDLQIFPHFLPFSLPFFPLSFQPSPIRIYFSHRPKKLIYCDRRRVSEFQTFFKGCISGIYAYFLFKHYWSVQFFVSLFCKIYILSLNIWFSLIALWFTLK